MRSKASASTGPAGLAKHQVSGTISTPASLAAPMAPAAGTAVVWMASISPAPATSGGKPPGRRKSC